ncbi:hypothetical protein C8F01DRAFT_1081361 [Mycena amicta]|nr:hypothetical protein C8F01DRAFT_1081361 [Mycena amicta]
MPPTADSAARLDGTLAYLRVAASTLGDMASAFRTPFMQTIANTTGSLITAVQNVRRNKSECIEMMEYVQDIIAAIFELELDSGSQESLDPQALSNLGQFTETLHKLYAFMHTRQQTNRLTQFLRQNEMNALMKDCQSGLQHALEIFKVNQHIKTLTEMKEMRARAEQRHRELRESLADVSLATTSAPSAGAPRHFNSSSNSLSMVPGKPQIFHGRDNELEDIAKTIAEPNPARIAILGPGGIGKTALAKAVLHHTAIKEKFPRQIFVPCHTASDKVELAALIASYIGLKPGRDLTRAVLRQFTNGPATLLVLDNIETAWEAMEARAEVEDFLSLLSEIAHLGLVITLRGIERPDKIQWNRPFLPPLGPVSADAARQILVDIADDVHDSRQLDQVLSLTDNVPLVIELVAHLVDFEGPAYILERWESERISLLSNGADGGNALEISIGISLSSPRLAAYPGAWDLLRLLAILPDGLSDAELQHMNLPIHNILSSKVTLARISLAYTSHDRRLRMLNPVREFIQRAYPPSESLVHAVVEYFHVLLKLYEAYNDLELQSVVIQLTANLHNIQASLGWSLKEFSTPAALHVCMDCVLLLSSFRRITLGSGAVTLLEQFPELLEHHPDGRLETLYAMEMFRSWATCAIDNPTDLQERGMRNLKDLSDPTLQAKASKYTKAALDSTKLITASHHQECGTLNQLAYLNIRTGNYSAACAYASESRNLSLASGDLFQEAVACRIHATSLCAQGDYKPTTVITRRGQEILQVCGLTDSPMYRSLMHNEADCHLAKTEYPEALTIHREILTKIADREQEPFGYGMSLLNVVQIQVAIYAPEAEIRRNLDEIERLFLAARYPVGITICNTFVAALELRMGNHTAARNLFAACLADSWGSYTEIVVLCLEHIADIQRWPKEHMQQSFGHAIVLLGLGLNAHDRLATHKALRFLGDVFLLQGDSETAYSLQQVALEGFEGMDVHQGRAECLVQMGNILFEQDKISEAVDHWEKSLPLFQRAAQQGRANFVRGKIARAKDVCLLMLAPSRRDQREQSFLSAATVASPSAAMNTARTLSDVFGGSGEES